MTVERQRISIQRLWVTAGFFVCKLQKLSNTKKKVEDEDGTASGEPADLQQRDNPGEAAQEQQEADAADENRENGSLPGKSRPSRKSPNGRGTEGQKRKPGMSPATSSWFPLAHQRCLLPMSATRGGAMELHASFELECDWDLSLACVCFKNKCRHEELGRSWYLEDVARGTCSCLLLCKWSFAQQDKGPCAQQVAQRTSCNICADEVLDAALNDVSRLMMRSELQAQPLLFRLMARAGSRLLVRQAKNG